MKKNQTFVGAVLLFLSFFCWSSFAFGQVSGTVFQDYNGNGVQDGLEPGVGGVTVTAYSNAGVVGVPAISAVNGTYSVAVPAGTDVRVEFVIPMGSTLCVPDNALDFPAYSGGTNGTSVQFVTAPSTGVNFGLSNPADFVDPTLPNPMLWVPCYVNGAAASSAAEPAIVGVDYNATTKVSEATVGDIGSTWGLAYSRQAKRLFTSAFLKRHSGLGPLGSGGIYMIDPATNVVTNFLNLDALGFPTRATGTYFGSVAGTTVNYNGVIGTDAERGLGVSTAPSRDVTAFAQVGRVALGDVDISDDGRYLWTINLFDRKLYRIDLTNAAAPVAPTAGNVTSWTITDPCGNGENRPFAVKYYRGKVYVGVVCSGEAGGALTASVYAFDGSTFSLVFDFGLDYPKGPSFSSGQAFLARWNSWTDDFSSGRLANPGTNNAGWSYPQPIFSDIEFDDDGSLILGFADRGSHQMGWGNWEPAGNNNELWITFAGGDILRAYLNPTSCDWELENNGTAGPNTTIGAGNNDGPGGGEYYHGDFFSGLHFETALGGLALLRGTNQVVSSVYDPENFDQFGLVWFNNITGNKDDAYTIGAPGNPFFGGSNSTFGKGGALGDTELEGNPPPLEIGNRVWNDTNNNGVQDPDEGGISGIAVTLWKEDGAGNFNQIASATTDGAGNYFFSSASGTSTASVIYGVANLVPNMNYELRFPTMATVGGDMLSLTTPNNGGADANADARDSDANTGGVVAFTTGGVGANNHSYDVGYGMMVMCLTPTATLTPTAATCTGSTANNDGTITLAATTNATHYGVSLGATYTGPTTIAGATAIPGTLPVDIITNAPNAGATYVVRLFNGADDCFVDEVVMVAANACAPASTCDCTEYIYVAERDLSRIHKFAIEPTTGALTEINPSGPWYPNGAASELPSPHGTGIDLNGFLYVAENWSDPNADIRRLTCDGTILPENDPANPLSFRIDAQAFNITAIGNKILYNQPGGGTGSDPFALDYTSIEGYDICTQQSIGEACFVDDNGNPVSTRWGFWQDHNEFLWAYAIDGGDFIYRFTLDDIGSGTCVEPLYAASAGTYFTENRTQVRGITTDLDNNIYLVNSQGFGQAGRVTKIDVAGNVVAQTPLDNTNGDGGWFGMVGIIYAESCDCLYSSNYTTVDDCVTKFPLDLNPANIVAAVGPVGGNPSNNTGAIGGKAIGKTKECCPTSNVNASETVCYNGTETNYFLNELYSCGDGVICEGQWSELSDPNNVFLFNDCDLSVTVSGEGCATYVLEKTTPATGNQQCGAFRIEVEICTVSPAATLTPTAATCTGSTANDDGTITLAATTNATHYGVSLGATYTGPTTIAGATAIPGTLPVDIITNAPNAGATYVVRLFNGADDCFVDEVVMVAAFDCNACNITLTPSISACYLDPTTGESVASLNVEVSWSNPPGPSFMDDLAAPRMDSIAVTINGVTKYVYQEAPYINRGQTVIGYYILSSPQLLQFTVPADGAAAQSIVANFTGDLSCSQSATYDRPAACPSDPCVAGANTVGGQAFEDFNGNGTLDEGEPSGVAGITVRIYGCDASGNSVLLGTTVTDEQGNYYFDPSNTTPAIVNGEDYRLEFETPGGSQFLPTCGEQNGYTTVQFASSPTCDVNLGLVEPTSACPENPDIVVTCYVGGRFSGTGAQNFGTIVTYPFDAPDGNFGPNSGNNAGPSNVYYGYHNQTGAVYGLAYRAQDSLMFSSTVMRRQSGTGPLGLGGIYVTDFAQPAGTNGTNAPTSSFLDLSFGGTFNFGGSPARADLAATPTATPNRDSEALPLVGTVAIGDIDISADGNTLYVVNLQDRHLYQVDISGYDGTAGTLPTQAEVNRYAYPNPCGGTGEVRPWALKMRGDNLYVGFVCDATTTDNREDLRAYVYIFNTTTNTFGSTPIFDFPLNYPRGAGTMDAGLWDKNVWEPWSNDWEGTIADQNDWYKITDGTIAGQPRIIYDYPQPILADIEIDVDNTMVLVFNDRTSMQVGNLEIAPSGPTFMGHTAAGDILRAFSPDGVTYVLESEAMSGGLTGSGPGNFQGPGYGEFFDDNFFSNADGTGQLVHSELVVGGAAIAPGSGLTVVATADPANGTNFANGTRTYSNTTGQAEAVYTVYTSAALASAATFGKTAGLGDIELRCDPYQKLEIGNYVWVDENNDGIQDPCETPLEGVTVELYNAVGDLVGTTSTNAEGEYYFNDSNVTGGLSPTTMYSIVIGNGQYDPSTGLLTTSQGTFALTVAGAGQVPNNTLNDSNGVPLLSGGMGNLAGLEGYPSTTLTTPLEGNVDHSFDFGFFCNSSIAVANPFTICSNQDIDLTRDASVTPSGLVVNWNTPDGDGVFLDLNGVALSAPFAFGTAVFYRPGPGDRIRGDVTLELAPATNAGLCDPGSATVLITILKTDCGSFPWGGN